jgi:acetyl-CoA carboxylase carboxyltransferase component
VRKPGQGGGEKKVEDQHSRGKMTARERIAILLDFMFEKISRFV